MPDRIEHYAAGVVAGTAAIPVCRETLESKLTPLERVFCLSAALLGSRLPDLLETPDDPGHREVFHSVLSAVLLGMGVQRAIAELRGSLENAREMMVRYGAKGFQVPIELVQRYQFDRLVICFLMGLAFGYESHLMLDETTPKGLPLIG